MQVKLLGTGAAEGMPALFCACPTCRECRRLGGKDIRTRSSALFDGVLKVDLPPDTLHHVISEGLDLTKVRHLFFTHSHDDHCAVSELQYLSWMFVPYTISESLHIYASDAILKRIRETLDTPDLPIRMHLLTRWQTVEAGYFRVTPIVANHTEHEECFNFLIADGNHSFLYATDTGWWSEETWKFLETQSVDAMVIECTKGMNRGGYMAHLSIPDIVDIRMRMLETGIMQPGARVITTHHSHMAGMLHTELESHLGRHQIEVGYDGLVIDV